MQQAVQGLRKRIRSHPEIGVNDLHRIGIEALTGNTHAKTLPHIPQDLAERPHKAVPRRGLRCGGYGGKAARHI